MNKVKNLLFFLYLIKDVKYGIFFKKKRLINLPAKNAFLHYNIITLYYNDYNAK